MCLTWRSLDLHYRPILSVKIFLTWRSLNLHYRPINTGRIILQITDICSSFWKESFYYIPIGTRDSRRIKNSYKHSYSYSNFHNAVTLSKIFRAIFLKKLKKNLAISVKCLRLCNWEEKGKKETKTKFFVPKQPCKTSH